MKFFNMQELWFSSTAIRNGIDNKPSQEIFSNLLKIGSVLDVIRLYIKKPIRITSGYRCKKLNELVKGSKNSQHMQGLAIDFQVVGLSNLGLKDLFKLIAKGLIVLFDQLIWEFNSWVHISISSNSNRHQALIIDSSGTKVYKA